MKAVLTHTLVLMVRDFDNPFTLVIGASGIGVAHVYGT